jgi:beta-galactosidase
MPALLNDPTAIQRNREPMHAPWYAHVEVGRWVLSLNGDWAFRLWSCPADVPAGWQLPGFDDRAWARIPVPANWELHGHGQALYQNVAYPFHPANYPAAPAENPTGCYRTGFEMPTDWDGHRTFLEFGSVDSSFYCWVNGVEVGFSTDSKLPAHFEITEQVRPGRNYLAVRVYRWGTSSYLEKQDYWHLSGIQRSVRMVSKPTVHLRDWVHQVYFDAAFRDATLVARAWIAPPPGRWELTSHGGIHWPTVCGWTIAFRLLDDAGTTVAQAEAEPADRSPMYGPTSSRAYSEAFSAVVELTVSSPAHWTAETPALYHLLLELRAPNGLVVDVERTRVGFRQVDITDGVIRLNGQRLVFRGVNRHEFHPRSGRAMTMEDMREDLVAMKRLNFNSVRTCHYPDAEAWYDLCDELGMYVVDEANLETHGLEALASRDPQWAGAYLERAIRMCLRDRNHACVIAWSLGNESYVGPHHAAMAGWLRSTDPTRPVQYESGFPGAAVSDIMAPMYPQLDWIRRLMADPAESRPMVMCEYAYAKGNSTGNVSKFWDLVWDLPRFQGGFVWDWRDKAIERIQPDGSCRWDYGVPRFEPADVERMCLNGVVGPDLVPHPGAWEIKHVQAPILLRDESAAVGRLRLFNRHQFLSLDGFRLRWSLAEDGVEVTGGCQDCPPLAAGADTEVRLPVPTCRPTPGAELHLTVMVERIAATPWSAAGHEIDREQFTVATRLEVPVIREASGADLVIADAALTGLGWRLRLDPTSGMVASLEVGGEEQLIRPISPCLSRAPTDIDRAIGGQGYAGQWSACGMDLAEYKPSDWELLRLDAHRACIRAHGAMAASDMAPVAWIELAWMVHSSGDLIADLLVVVHAPVESVPRVGLVAALRGAERRLRWFGRGPFECYPDRREAAVVGRYEASVGELLTPYVFPQECGLRCDVRWLEIVDARGCGLSVQGMPLIHASALPVRLEDLRKAANLSELRWRDETSIHLDGFHMGVGGDTGWTRNVHPEWRLPPGHYRCRMLLRPLKR